MTAIPLSAVMGLVVHYVAQAVGQLVSAGTKGEFLIVAVAGSVGLLVYGGLALVLGMDEIRLLGRGAKRWRRA